MVAKSTAFPGSGKAECVCFSPVSSFFVRAAEARLLRPIAAATLKHLSATQAVSAISDTAVISVTKLSLVAARAAIAPDIVRFSRTAIIPPWRP
jgi:hypothetical protein